LIDIDDASPTEARIGRSVPDDEFLAQLGAVLANGRDHRSGVGTEFGVAPDQLAAAVDDADALPDMFEDQLGALPGFGPRQGEQFAWPGQHDLEASGPQGSQCVVRRLDDMNLAVGAQGGQELIISREY
jgi:hypothetical protein